MKKVEKWEYSHETDRNFENLDEKLMNREKEGWQVFTVTSYVVGSTPFALIVYRRARS